MTDPTYPAHPLPLDGVEPPRFFEWNTAPSRWELLCGRLLDRDPRFRAADLFELRGLKQYGLDALADIKAGGQVGLSAKCYERATASDVRDWSTDFLKEWETYWKARDVRIFILAVAAPNITNAANRDQIAKEKARFAAFGIDYEVWGPEPVYDRLRPHEDLVARFLGDPWRDMIFGPRLPAATAVDAVLLRQLEATQGVVAEQVAARMSGALEQLWSGESAAVASMLEAVKGTTVWPFLPDQLKATALRLSARIAIEEARLGDAETQAAAAAALWPTDKLIEAKIVQARQGPAAALEMLGVPSGVDARQYRASLYVAIGEIDEADRLLDDLGETQDPADLDRLRSFIRLGRGQFDEALSFAEAAAARAPRRLLVRLALSVARYANGLSPAIPPMFALGPIVPPMELVRQDGDSVARRRVALDEFKALAGTRLGDQAGLRDWVLAVLCCTPADRAEAEALVAARLEADPLDLAALYAITARSFPTDVSASLQALGERVDSGDATDGQVQAFVQLSMPTSTPPEIASRLEAALDRLSGDGLDEAKTLIEQLRTPAVPFDPAVRVMDWLNQDPPDPRGLELAGDLASAGRWSDLVPVLDRLDHFRTPTSTSLIAYTMHSAAEPAEALAFIDAHVADYPDGVLPLDMRRLRLSAMNDVDAAEAARISQALVLETGVAEDRKHLVGLLLSAGTVQTALPHIRRLLNDQAISPGDAIRYSIATVGDDVLLARALWRHGMKLGVPEALLLHALSQGYRLGLDDEVAPLMPRMAARAQSDAGDVWMIDAADLPAMLMQRRNEVEDVNTKLLDGLAPIHLTPRGIVGSLVVIYRLTPTTTFGPQPLLLLRHGSRPAEIKPPAPWDDWQVVLDPTALLIADQLDLLDHLEALTEPVLISRSLPDVLYGFEQDTPHGQPARVEAARQILAAVGAGRLGVATDETSAVRVRHELDEGETGVALSEVVDFIGDQTRVESGLITGQALCFSEGTLSALAMDGRLEPALDLFRCETTRIDLADATAEIQASEEGDRLASRVRALRERIAAGVATGRYVFLPDPPHLLATQTADDGEAEDAEADGVEPEAVRARRRTPLEMCLVNGLTAPSGPARVVWIDDRMTSGYWRTQENPIVTTADVLTALVAAGRLSEEDQRLRLLSLRRGGAAFIPMTADEVLPPLAAATVRNGRVVETETLTVLRRNLASALRLDRHLAIGGREGRADEQAFISSTLRLTEDCLRRVWSDITITHEDRVARADWVWESLRVERCVRPLPVDAPGDAGNGLLASVTLAGLLCLGSQIDNGLYAERLERRKAYIDWLDRRALKPRSGRGNAEWVRRLSEQFRSLYEATFEIEVDPEEIPLVRKLRNDEINALPKELRRLVLDKPDFAEMVGMTSTFTTTAGPHTFDSALFWSAVARAVRTGRTTTRSREGASIALSWTDDLLKVGESAPTYMAVPFAQALAGKGAERRRAIEAHVSSLELTAERRDEAIAQAAKATSNVALVQAMTAAHESVVDAIYEDIASTLNGGRDFALTVLFPPPAKAALHALRLDRPGALPDRARLAWAELAGTFGEDQALLRLGGLPVDLAALVGDLEPSFPPSPVCLAHMAAGRLRAGTEPDKAISVLFAHAEDAHGLFIDLIEWTRKAYESDADWVSAPLDDQLALCWSHAHRLHTILSSLTDDFALLQQRFAERQPDQLFEQEVAGSRAFQCDRASAGLLRSSSLIYRGLAYVFGETAPWLDLPAEFQSAVALRVMAFATDAIAPDAGAMMAGPASTNAMGTWLDLEPTGLLDESLAPMRLRQQYLRSALDALERTPDDVAAWRMASLLVRSGCDGEDADRYRAAVLAANFAALGANAEGRSLCHVAMEGFAGLQPLSEPELLERMRAMAKGCATTWRGALQLGEKATDAVVTPLVLTLISGARDGDVGSTLTRLHHGALAAAQGWPALAGVFRTLFDRWYGRSFPSTDALWSACIDFRAWP